MQGPEEFLPAATADKEIATGLSIQAAVGGKQIVMQSCLPRDADINEYHALADKMYRVLERQEWKEAVAGLRGELEADETLEKRQLEDYERVEIDHAEQWKARGKKGEPVLGQKEEAARFNVKQNIKRVREEIERKKKLLADLEKKLKAEPGG